MLWRDLREYLTRLDELGELKRFENASWEEDIGGITELMIERRGPALLFDAIPGYPKGFRVASNIFNTPQRSALALGLEPTAEGSAERFAGFMEKLRPVPPREVGSGPITENIMRSEEVDLFRFPTPRWHESDGGRYIGTGCCVIQRDPENSFINLGAYRVAVHDKKTCAIFIEHGKNGDVIRRKYWARGEKCPVIVTAGQEPVLTILAGPHIYVSPYGVSELDVAGYIHGEPVPVLYGEFTKLPIPADAEIAIEGFIPSSAETMVPEGPFGEWTGYYAHGRRPETIIEVKAVYYRNDPIILGAPPARPVGGHWFAELGGEDVASKKLLEKAGIPGVQSVFLMARPNFRVVALKQLYREHVDDIVRILNPGGQRYSGHHIWVLVDNDIDISNPQEVLWAIASRCDPEFGVKIISGSAVWQLDPRVPPEERSEPDQKHGRKSYSAHNLVINACRPFDWINDFPPVNVNGPELRGRILRKWKELSE
jgi:4-hydroxy-3-polyprenylbenzoate decarboxylase